MVHKALGHSQLRERRARDREPKSVTTCLVMFDVRVDSRSRAQAFSSLRASSIVSQGISVSFPWHAKGAGVTGRGALAGKGQLHRAGYTMACATVSPDGQVGAR